MSRIKVVGLGVLAAAVSAVAASSASAVVFELTSVACLPPETTTTICWASSETGELFELKGEQSATMEFSAEESGEETLLAAKFGEEEVHITCTNVTGTGTFAQSKPLEVAPVIHGFIQLTGCKLLEPLGKKCKVPTELKTSEIEGVVGTTSEEVKFSPAPSAAKVFITIAVSNNGTESCPIAIAGSRNVTGSQVCQWVNHAEDLLAQLRWCKPTGSAVELGGNKAEFLLALDITLTGLEDYWDIIIT
jgi:hypothetical protein